MKLKLVFAEIIRLISILLAAYLIALWLLHGYDFWNGMYNIAIHDTYFVVSPISLGLNIFVPLAFCVFLIRIILQKAKNRFTLAACLLATGFNILMLLNVKALLTMMNRGSSSWTIYAPSSANTQGSVFLENCLLGTTVFLILTCLFLVFVLITFIIPFVRK